MCILRAWHARVKGQSWKAWEGCRCVSACVCVYVCVYVCSLEWALRCARVGQNCIITVFFGREITKCTVTYGVLIYSSGHSMYCKPLLCADLGLIAFIWSVVLPLLVRRLGPYCFHSICGAASCCAQIGALSLSFEMWCCLLLCADWGPIAFVRNVVLPLVVRRSGPFLAVAGRRVTGKHSTQEKEELRHICFAASCTKAWSPGTCRCVYCICVCAVWDVSSNMLCPKLFS